MDDLTLALRPYVLRFRAAQTERDRLQRELGRADIEFQASRQELDDALAAAMTDDVLDEQEGR